MATHGEADSYYNGAADQNKQGYGMQQPVHYPPPASNGYQQPPPNYGQNLQDTGQGPMASGDGKRTFDQTFKLDKPKYNDLWAGILVRPDPYVLVN